ncbi:hypothetical protein NRB_26650 [Novosphingobium sp. 11B]
MFTAVLTARAAGTADGGGAGGATRGDGGRDGTRLVPERACQTGAVYAARPGEKFAPGAAFSHDCEAGEKLGDGFVGGRGGRCYHRAPPAISVGSGQFQKP